MTPFALLTTLSLFGYHLTFDAEMTTPSDMSQFINTFQNGDTRLYNNHEEQNYVPYDPTNPAKPFDFTGGALVLQASPIPAGDQPYTSGLIETYGIFSQSSGYFEMRAAVPAGQGFWQAFWLLPDTYYPEIDILEQPNNSGTNTEYWTHTSTPTDNSGGFSDTGVDLTHGYHRYGFLWTSNTIQYVFDGNLVGWSHVLPPSMVGLQMYLIANMAVGDQYSWPGAPLPGASQTMSIDYIRAYSNDPTVPEVSQEPISSPDGVDTLLPLSPPPPATPPVVGSGPDTLVLQVAEDAYQGDAQFTISIDGRQHGGVLTALANHLVGQAQAFAFKGHFTGRHICTVSYLNDLSGNDGNRNLYVTGATINGVAVQNAALNEYYSEPQSFGFSGDVVPPVTIGAGPDTMLLGISEDKIIGNAAYSISVDGVQQGGKQAVSALHAYGQSQSVAVNGTFGPAAHTVGVTFINGTTAGSAFNGRNLYVNSLSYNGIVAQNAAAELTSKGSTALQTAVQQPDTISLSLSEDAYQGDAQAQISIDGMLLDTPVITAAKSGGTPQILNYSGKFGGAAVPHKVVVNYLNDAYAGRGQDRNLYVQGITVDGASIAGNTALMRGGPVSFSYIPPPPAQLVRAASGARAAR